LPEHALRNLEFGEESPVGEAGGDGADLRAMVEPGAGEGDRNNGDLTGGFERGDGAAIDSDFGRSLASGQQHGEIQRMADGTGHVGQRELAGVKSRGAGGSEERRAFDAAGGHEFEHERLGPLDGQADLVAKFPQADSRLA